MVVMILERVPANLRGKVTRWMLEPKAGVFVGTLNAMVREKLWERVCGKIAGGAARLIWTDNSEQGFTVRFWGATDRWVVNLEGLNLIQIPEDVEKT